MDVSHKKTTTQQNIKNWPMENQYCEHDEVLVEFGSVFFSTTFWILFF